MSKTKLGLMLLVIGISMMTVTTFHWLVTILIPMLDQISWAGIVACTGMALTLIGYFVSLAGADERHPEDTDSELRYDLVEKKRIE